MGTIGQILHLIRVRQWVKNIILFVPLFFAAELGNISSLTNVFIAFLAFCFVASSVYVLNDIRDLEKDRLHPEKKNRPIASGAISKKTAIIILIIFLVAGLGISIFTTPWVTRLLLIYVGINLLYSFGLKELALVDVSIIAAGFLIRILTGGLAADVPSSKWLLLLSFLLALFIAFAKRRDDLIILKQTNVSMRESLKGYTLPFVDGIIAFLSAVVAVLYCMYTISDEVIQRIDNEYIFLSAIPVVLGMIRYLQVTMVFEKSGSPVKILSSDRFIQLMILIWVGFFGILLYS
jgi:4-hydroxybenzoate polyprenyltransferase